MTKSKSKKHKKRKNPKMGFKIQYKYYTTLQLLGNTTTAKNLFSRRHSDFAVGIGILIK